MYVITQDHGERTQKKVRSRRPRERSAVSVCNLSQKLSITSNTLPGDIISIEKKHIRIVQLTRYICNDWLRHRPQFVGPLSSNPSMYYCVSS